VTRSKCGGIFTANFLESVPVKKNKKRSIFDEGMDKSIVSPFFDSRRRWTE